MSILLLVIIYIAFISLGLPDGVFGGAWPAIQQDLNANLELGGVVMIIVTLMTIVSSLATSALVRKLGVGLLLVLSTALTVTSLIGFSLATSTTWVLLSAIPIGLGAGAIDAALNNYVANHYKAHHMNWLHALWGFGATLGPIVFAITLGQTGDWHQGFGALAVIQGIVFLILLLSLVLWLRVPGNKTASAHKRPTKGDVSYRQLLRDRTIFISTVTFFFYVGIEVAIGLWLASYLVLIQGAAIETAAIWTGIYYATITIGRILAGFLSVKLSSKQAIRIGLALALAGILLIAVDISSAASITGIALIGLGIAPIYPALIHETPRRFGSARSTQIMSLQMVGGYAGASIIPATIGLFSGMLSLQVFIITIPVIIVILILSTEYINHRLSRRFLNRIFPSRNN